MCERPAEGGGKEDVLVYAELVSWGTLVSDGEEGERKTN